MPDFLKIHSHLFFCLFFSRLKHILAVLTVKGTNLLQTAVNCLLAAGNTTNLNLGTYTICFFFYEN